MTMCPPSARQAGFSLPELMCALAFAVVLTAAAVPYVTTSVDGAKTWGAAHYLSGRLNLARSIAVKNSTFVALRVVPEGGGYRCTMYADGNGNGVRTADINAGIDRPVGPSERFDQKFAPVTFGILDGVTAIDSTDTLGAGSDPVRFGQSDLASFNPNGSATAGTFYVRGRGRYQLAVRVLGVTGRVRVLRFNFRSAQWDPQ